MLYFKEKKLQVERYSISIDITSDHPVLARWSLRRFVVRMLLEQLGELGIVNVLLQWSDFTTISTLFIIVPQFAHCLDIFASRALA